MSAGSSTSSRADRYAGIHLSGSNSHKTSVVVLEGDPLAGPVKIEKLYEKIGSYGSLFSDDRLVEILTHARPFAEVFIDCPLTEPPCVACRRPYCPGAVKCDDVSVAYMLAVSQRVRGRGARKARPVNPQSQRLWDVLQLEASGERLEPSYSANYAPLVTRAITLQRRLNALTPRIQLKETAVGNTLYLLRAALDLPETVFQDYRNFEVGRERRREILDKMGRKGWLSLAGSGEHLEALERRVEAFQGFITAWVAALHGCGLTAEKPAHYVEREGWVYLPDLSMKVEFPLPMFG